MLGGVLPAYRGNSNRPRGAVAYSNTATVAHSKPATTAHPQHCYTAPSHRPPLASPRTPKRMNSDKTRRALTSLNGLSVGDAFGEQFFGNPGIMWNRIAGKVLPETPWNWSDDTAMARVLVAQLQKEGNVDPDTFSKSLAKEYLREPGRGYGTGAAQVLNEISHGARWQQAAGKLFGGSGSKGNGAAMRVAPLGAYFAEEIDTLVEQAGNSARVTHAHHEGIAGAVAVALATAWYCRQDPADGSIFEFLLDHTPPGQLRRNIRKAQDLPATETVAKAADVLGNGSRVLAEDTVPFCIWGAAHHAPNFEQAMWSTVSALGDRDTTCAIVGGIIASKVPPPKAWQDFREPLNLHLT